MNYRPSRLASWFLLLLLTFLLLVFHAEFLAINLLALVFATLLSNLPPKDLFERCAELPIDRVAWKDFFARYNHDIEATVRRIIGYPGQGRYCYLFEDIVQRFYQRLLENERRALHALRGIEEGQAHAYLRTIAAGVAFKMIGSEPPTGLPLETPGADNSVNVDQVKTVTLAEREIWSEDALVLWVSLSNRLWYILRGRNKYRNMLIFKLVTMDGFSPKEISQFACFGMKSRHAVEQLISRTRQKLRDDFRK